MSAVSLGNTRLDTAAFLAKILPSRGHYFVATLVAGSNGKTFFRHHLADNHAHATLLAQTLDQGGGSVYHACASYREPFVMVDVTDPATGEVKKRKRERIQENVLLCRSFWIDLDVEAGNPIKYETQAQAIEALAAFIQATGLPWPMVVSSGYGVHVYWPLQEDISAAQWVTTARNLKILAKTVGLKQDDSRTADPASVLRPVGTHNRKKSDPVPVTLEHDVPPYPFENFRALVDQACKDNDAEIRQDAKINDDPNARFMIQTEYPESHADVIADRCRQIGQMRDTAGCVPEPQWYSAIQVLNHTVEADDVIHRWSSGYKGYSHAETETKRQQVKSYGPTTCATFNERNPEGCKGCPFRGKITSPIQLGWKALDLDSPPTTETASTRSEAIPTAIGPDVASAHAPLVIDASAVGQNAVNGGALCAAPTGVVPTEELRLLQLNDEYAWVSKPAQVFRFRYRDFIDLASFRAALANRRPLFAKTGGKEKPLPLAEAWLKYPGRAEYEDVVYEPGKSAIVEDRVNLWPGWGCDAVAGDITPWRRLLEYLFTDSPADRMWFECWLAYPFQVPGAKMNTATVLWSTTQGVGKSLLGYTIVGLYGKSNCAVITSDDLQSSFNGWARAKQFVLGEETTSGNHRAAAGVLKHMITGDTIQINEKHQPHIELRNTMNFLFTSNRPDAFHIDPTDRRFFVKEITGERMPDAFYAEFVNWRDEKGGLEALRHHFITMDLQSFNPKSAAPITASKLDMIESSYSDVERWLKDYALPEDAERFPAIVSTENLRHAYESDSGQRITATAIGRALRRLGVPDVSNRINLNGKRAKVHAIRDGDHWKARSPEDWLAEYLRRTQLAIQAAVPSSALAVH